MPSSGPKEVSRAVEAARAAFKEWSALTGMERGRTLIAAAAKVRDTIPYKPFIGYPFVPEETYPIKNATYIYTEQH